MRFEKQGDQIYNAQSGLDEIKCRIEAAESCNDKVSLFCFLLNYHEA